MSDYHKKYPINMTPDERREYWAAQHRRYVVRKNDKQRLDEFQNSFPTLKKLLPMIDPFLSNDNDDEIDPEFVKKSLKHIKGLIDCLQQFQLKLNENTQISTSTSTSTSTSHDNKQTTHLPQSKIKIQLKTSII